MTLAPRRILVVAYTIHPDQGSEPGRGWGWVSALARRGHTIELVAVPYRDNESAIERARAKMGAAGERIHPHFVAAPPAPGYARIFPGRLRGMALEHAAYVGWQREALQYAQTSELTDVDVVHHVSFGSLQGGCALWALGRPLVFGPVGGGQVAPWRMRGYFGKEWKTELFRSVVWAKAAGHTVNALRTVRRAGLVVVENSDTKRAAARRGASAIEMYCGSVPVEFLRADTETKIESDERTLIWVGKFEPRKGPAIAIRSMLTVRERCPQARLLMCGDGPLRADMQKLISQLGLGSCVTLMGHIPRSELLRLFDSADAMLFTSLRDTFGDQNAEAWARGLPNVFLNHHGVKDHSPVDGSVPVDLGDPGSLPRRFGAAAADVLLDRELRSAMSNAARKHAEAFTCDSFALAAEQWYETVLSRPAR